MDESKPQDAETWAIVELMGHVKVAGRLSEEEKFGSKLGRIDIPTAEGGFLTQFFGGGSVYRITFVSEQVARDVARRNTAAPVASWDYPKQLTAAPSPSMFDHDDDDHDDIGSAEEDDE